MEGQQMNRQGLRFHGRKLALAVVLYVFCRSVREPAAPMSETAAPMSETAAQTSKSHAKAAVASLQVSITSSRLGRMRALGWITDEGQDGFGTVWRRRP